MHLTELSGNMHALHEIFKTGSTENSSDDILYEFYELEIYRKI